MKKYEGKKVFIRTNNQRTYSGVVKEVADVGDNTIFISLMLMTGFWATFSMNEIAEIREEK